MQGSLCKQMGGDDRAGGGNPTCTALSRLLLKLVKRDLGGVITTPPVAAL